MAVCVDIGVFAHDEAAGIAAMLAGVLAQDIWADAGYDLRLLVLANGCTDDTVARASGLAEVVDLPQGGKSRTWNAFVHELSRREAEVLICCDADIALPDPATLRLLVQGLLERPAVKVFTSRPVKDIAQPGAALGAQDRLIAAAGGTLEEWRRALCGQLYALRTGAARGLHLPVGLPVEDGFLRAMLLTDALTVPEDLTRIDGGDAYHVYASERRIGALIRHQTRIVIGSAINAACFAHLRALPQAARHAELARAAGDDGWLARVLAEQLPRAPFGYVPLHFLTKRSIHLLRQQGTLASPKRLAVLVAGFGFDLIVYLNAQIRMARGTGPGHW
ncbi:glycosyltransferase [Rhodobacter ferrooxidans]|uniref:Glycosyl transferase family 2 n=1 Tax=Rhodobacter ferrooxidans TaxID=371731 RepID=C8RXJ2_9RHOB|nr:glycosyltransferase [Rhodobacter sp. SW2]EEW26717.1 glycosyl transferase family 2 [Rhodobacter sp. SW2]